MSVYTQLTEQDFTHLLSRYDLGSLVSAQGIAAGIENTNYKLQLIKNSDTTSYFLTVFETLSHAELDFFIPLLHHLDESGCKVAGPKIQINNDFILSLHDKPAALFECLDGGHPDSNSVSHCKIIAAELARIHLAASNFPGQHDNPRGFYWLQKQIQNQALTEQPDDQVFLEQALTKTQAHWKQWQTMDLPRGFIHGDLFPDNCLFQENQLSGVIDFYAGGLDYWVYDLAILILAWASDGSKLNTKRMQALIEGYESVRALTADESAALNDFIQLATLRFWVSRLIAQRVQQGASLTTEKDPDAMKTLLQHLVSSVPS